MAGFSRIVDGEQARVGFWVSRFVAASTDELAAAEAMELVPLKLQAGNLHSEWG